MNYMAMWCHLFGFNPKLLQSVLAQARPAYMRNYPRAHGSMGVDKSKVFWAQNHAFIISA